MLTIRNIFLTMGILFLTIRISLMSLTQKNPCRPETAGNS